MAQEFQETSNRTKTSQTNFHLMDRLDSIRPSIEGDPVLAKVVNLLVSRLYLKAHCSPIVFSTNWTIACLDVRDGWDCREDDQFSNEPLNIGQEALYALETRACEVAEMLYSASFAAEVAEERDA